VYVSNSVALLLYLWCAFDFVCLYLFVVVCLWCLIDVCLFAD